MSTFWDNKRGSIAIFYLMIAILFFLLGMALAPSIVDTTGESRDFLNCGNSNITNQDKGVCYQLDSYSALWIGVMFGIGGVLLARLT